MLSDYLSWIDSGYRTGMHAGMRNSGQIFKFIDINILGYFTAAEYVHELFLILLYFNLNHEFPLVLAYAWVRPRGARNHA